MGLVVRVSSGRWAGTTSMATYDGDRIFAIWRNILYEVYATDWKKVGTGYNTGSALVQLGGHMYTTIGSNTCGRLYRITVTGTPRIEVWGSTGIYSLALTTVSGGNYIMEMVTLQPGTTQGR